MLSTVNAAPDTVTFQPVYNIWDPHLELPLKVLLSEVQTGNLNGEKYVAKLEEWKNKSGFCDNYWGHAFKLLKL